MSGEGGHRWPAPRMAARLAALRDLVPAPACYVIWRATTTRDGQESAGYELPDRRGPQDEAAFRAWLGRRRLAGFGRMAVAVLVIREQLDERGQVREAVLERRRGGAGGPFDRNLARVEFSGAVERLRRYRAQRDGQLEPMPEDARARKREAAVELDPESFAGEDAAVLARLGPEAVILDRRAPLTREAILCLSRIIHVRLPDGREIGCGVGWHGTSPFVLEAGFPRHQPPGTPPAPDLDAMAAAHDLIRLETRRDSRGTHVLARPRGRLALVMIRRHGLEARVTPYLPSRLVSASADQRRWMVYVETYEGRMVIDTWRDAARGRMNALTLDRDREAWRSLVDTDGVEVRRHLDHDAAAAVLHRLWAAQPEDPDGGLPPPAREWDASDDFTLRFHAFLAITGALRAVLANGEGTAARLDLLRPLLVQARRLGVRSFAGALWRLSRASEDGFAEALDGLIRALRDELTLVRLVPPRDEGAPPPSKAAPAPMETRFPSAAFDLEDAVHCLAQNRTLEAAGYAARAARDGLSGLERAFALPPLTNLPWSGIIAAVREALPREAAVAGALTAIRRAWRRPGLNPGTGYSEPEAEAMLVSVAAFLTALATALEIKRVPGTE